MAIVCKKKKKRSKTAQQQGSSPFFAIRLSDTSSLSMLPKLLKYFSLQFKFLPPRREILAARLMRDKNYPNILWELCDPLKFRKSAMLPPPSKTLGTSAIVDLGAVKCFCVLFNGVINDLTILFNDFI